MGRSTSDLSKYVHEYSTKAAESMFVAAINQQRVRRACGTPMGLRGTASQVPCVGLMPRSLSKAGLKPTSGFPSKPVQRHGSDSNDNHCAAACECQPIM
jgi:hypothetical protein